MWHRSPSRHQTRGSKSLIIMTSFPATTRTSRLHLGFSITSPRVLLHLPPFSASSRHSAAIQPPFSPPPPPAPVEQENDFRGARGAPNHAVTRRHACACTSAAPRGGRGGGAQCVTPHPRAPHYHNSAVVTRERSAPRPEAQRSFPQRFNMSRASLRGAEGRRVNGHLGRVSREMVICSLLDLLTL